MSQTFPSDATLFLRRQVSRLLGLACGVFSKRCVMRRHGCLPPDQENAIIPHTLISTKIPGDTEILRSSLKEVGVLVLFLS